MLCVYLQCGVLIKDKAGDVSQNKIVFSSILILVDANHSRSQIVFSMLFSTKYKVLLYVINFIKLLLA